MMNFSVELYDRLYTPVKTDKLQVRPLVYSAHAMGGPHKAEIEITGDSRALWDCHNWLRYFVIIRNPHGQAVWSGIVHEAQVRWGALSVGVALEKMANRVAVAYTYTDADGTAQRATTDWAEDTVSTGEYGDKERLDSLGDTSSTLAENLRDRTLAALKYPQVTQTLENGAGQAARLYCVGLWSTLGWKYYSNSAGKEIYDATINIDHMIGFALTSTQIGFRNDRLHDLGARLGVLLDRNQLIVTGSASNNGTHTIEGAGSGSQQTYAASTIDFDASDDIRDNAGGGLGFLLAEQMILVSGASDAANNGYKFINVVAGPTRVEVKPADIVTRSASPTITIVQGHSATMAATFVQEGAGSSVTLTALGSRVAQSFTLSVNASWAATEIVISARKVGSPADNLRVSIYSNSSGNPNTQLATGTVAGSALSTAMAKYTISLGAGATLSYGTTYHLVVERTGSADFDDFFVCGLTDAVGYSGGSLKVWNGSSWATRSPDAELPFEIWSTSDTGTQLRNMLVDGGQFFAMIDAAVTTSVTERQYRAGDLTALDEALRLMAAGNSAGKRLIATVTPERMATVQAEPASDEWNPLLQADGSLRDPTRPRWEDGKLPVGRWVTLADVPTHIAQLAQVTPFFVEEAEYNVESGVFRLAAREATTWD
jgi:hypothetical protein